MKKQLFILISIVLPIIGISQVEVTNLYELLDGTSATLKWSDGSGSNDGYLVIVRATSDVGATSPTGDGSSYTASTIYGNGTQLANGYIGYIGADSSVTISSLTTATQYYVKVYSRSGTNWSTAASLNFYYNPPSSGEVYISEYARNSNTAYSYVELYNSSSNDVNLSGSKIISSGSNNQVIDLKTDLQEDQITIPANGFLILCRDRSQSGFESHWGVDLSNTGYSVNYNRCDINAFGNQNLFTLKLGGTEDVDDGTTIDSSKLKPSSTSNRTFQLPIGYWASNEQSNSTATPGSLDFTDDFTIFKMTYADGSWRVATGESFTKPDNTTGSVRIKIKDDNVSIDDGSILSAIFIEENYGIELTNQDITTTDLFIEEHGYVKITGTGSLTATGNIQKERNGHNASDDFNIWGTPFASDVSITSAFSDIAPCDVYVFKASTQEWKNDATVGASVTCQGNVSTIAASNVIASPEGDPDGNFDIGRGYFIAGSSSNTRSFTVTGGSLNNGNINVNIYRSSAAVVDGSNDWNYLSNPYPSALNTASFLTTNSSVIQNAIYVYNPSGTIHQTTSFNTYNSTDNFQLASCQGFAVTAVTGGDGLAGTASFTNSMRSETNGDFRKQLDWYGVYLSVTNNLFHSDQTRLYFSNNASEKINNVFDAYKMVNPEISIASLANATPLVFNGLPALDTNNYIVPLFVNSNQNSPLIFKLDSLVNNDNISVILEDRYTNKFTDLKKTLYSVNTRPATYSDRFFLHLKQINPVSKEDNPISLNTQSTNVQEGITSVIELLKEHPAISSFGSTIQYQSNSKAIFKSISVYNITGKLINQYYPNQSNGTIQISNIPNGIYIISGKLDNNITLNEKLFIQ